MDQGANVTRIDYANLWSREPLALSLRVITDHRDYHGRTFAWDGAPAPVADGDTLSIPAGGTADLHVRLENGRAEASGTWYRGFDLAQERARGLTDSEDHVFAGTVSATLAPGNTVQLVANCAARPAAIDRGAHAAGRAREQSLLGAWHAARGADAAPAPDWVRQLVLAADQFIVGRRLPDGSDGHTVIAGYHWFSDWGRDTMISLPGLTLATGRPEIARSLLTSFAAAVDRGMIPNRFPDAGTARRNSIPSTPPSGSSRRCAPITPPPATRRSSKPCSRCSPASSTGIAGARATRIRLDPADGLIFAGEPGVQLTWMDAKVGDWVVTPRIGKPVEVNALWCSGLRFMAQAARALGRPAGDYDDLLARAEGGFRRFWNSARGYCFDVLDGPHGHEAGAAPEPDLRRQPVAAAAGARAAARGRRRLRGPPADSGGPAQPVAGRAGL